MPEDNGKENPDEPYANKYQKHVASSYCYKQVRVDDKFSKLFKSYLNEDGVYSFINCILKKRKYFSDVMKKYFSKELIITKKDNEDFEKSISCWICDNNHVDGDITVRDHCHITEKYECFQSYIKS